ncbi:MAG: hypothetical protein NVS2B14_04930 [Chamaesiphon sp.]
MTNRTEQITATYHPGLRMLPIDEPAEVIPRERLGSILGWLEESGRLMERVEVEVSLDEESSILDYINPEDIEEPTAFEEEDDDLGSLDLED